MSENNTSTAPIETPNTEASAEDTGEEAQETEASASEGTEGAKPEASKPETKKEKEARIKKFKLKVDGKEFEEEVNLDDEEYFVKQLQLAKAAQKRMSEKADLEKKVYAFIEELRTNPRKALSDPDLGVDLQALAAAVVQDQIEQSKKSPEQIEKEKLEARLKELEDERKREKEDFETREFERLQQQALEQYDMQIDKALSGSDLPKKPATIKRIADYMLLGINNGLDVTPEDVVPLVRKEMMSDLQEIANALPEEALEALFGDVIKRVRKKSMAKAKQAPTAPLSASVKDTGVQSKKSDTAAAAKKSFKQYFGV